MQEQEFRRSRDQFTVELRKQNRESLFKRRRGQEIEQGMQDEIAKKPTKLIVDPNNKQLIQQIMERTFSLADVPALCAKLADSNIVQQHLAVIGLRILVSEQENFELMQQIIDAGSIPKLISYMKQSQLPQLQLEATWILTNIACGRTSQCQSIIEKNGLEAFFQVISENTPKIVEQAIWGLGNIAADNVQFRDIILKKGGLDVLLKSIESSTTIATLQQGSWALSSLCRGTPRPKYNLIASAVPVLGKLIMSGVLNSEQVCNCLWAIAANSEVQKTRIQKVVQIKGLIPYLFQRIRKEGESVSVIASALRVIGNISNGNELQTQELLRAGCLEIFTLLLDHPKNSIKRQICWIISNICVGTASQIGQIINCIQLLKKLFTLFHNGESEVKKQICYIIANLCHCGPPEKIFKLMEEYGCLDNLIHYLMNEENGKCLQGGLQALFEALNVGRKLGGQNIVFSRLQQESGFFERLQDLQKHPSNEVYQKLIKIFHDFFSTQASFI